MGDHGSWQEIESFDAFAQIERVSDDVWDIVTKWRLLAQETVGKQLIRAVDSVGANLVEGDGRYHFKEKLHHCYIARGSVLEARYWVRRAHARRLVTDATAHDLDTRLGAARRWINTLIGERRRWASQVREESGEYLA
jgi:four helix bundle protein